MAKNNPKRPIDRGAPASVVVAKFGGLSRFAAAIQKPPSTVHRWLVKGHIDGAYHAEIMAAAKVPGNLVDGVRLVPLDFVDTRIPDDRVILGGAAPGLARRPPESLPASELSHTYFTRADWARGDIYPR